MEIRQLEYFVAAVNEKSLSKAAEKVYTSQSNISKAISKLEENLGTRVLKRTSKGVFLTTTGEHLYEQAMLLLNTVDHMHEIADDASLELLRINSYQSHFISEKLIDFYKIHAHEKMHVEYSQGDIYEIMANLKSYKTDIGILYYADGDERRFQKNLNRNGLEKHEIGAYKLCVHIGCHHPMYHREDLAFEDLNQLNFVQEGGGAFSILEQLSIMSKGAISSRDLKHVVHTNIGHTILKLVKETNLCHISFDLSHSCEECASTKALHIKDCKEDIHLCYVTRIDHELNHYEKELVHSIGSQK